MADLSLESFHMGVLCLHTCTVTLSVGWLCIFTVQVGGSTRADTHIPNYFGAKPEWACLVLWLSAHSKTPSPHKPAACSVQGAVTKLPPNSIAHLFWLREARQRQNDPSHLTLLCVRVHVVSFNDEDSILTNS